MKNKPVDATRTATLYRVMRDYGPDMFNVKEAYEVWQQHAPEHLLGMKFRRFTKLLARTRAKGLIHSPVRGLYFIVTAKEFMEEKIHERKQRKHEGS